MNSENAEIFENFYGVYLLLCENPKFKGRTYIGYTVDPVRRLIRHNAGMEFGGAKRTNNKGPWNMVLVVHGFPNSRSALRFEWAWQHPQLSRHLRHVPKRKTRESVFKYLLSVVSAMLQVPPWCRLPLVIRWLDQNFVKNYSELVRGPDHMVVKYGKVVAKKIGKGRRKKNSDDKENDNFDLSVCNICSKTVEKEELVNCVEKECDLIAHMICLAMVFRKDKKILPIEGECPKCHRKILWGNVIRKKIGCQV